MGEMKSPFRSIPVLLAMTSFPISGLRGEVPEIMEVLERHVETGEIAGGLTYVGDREEDIDISHYGYADIVAEKAMARDTIFWIASMTKPITATAIMMLQEEGLLSVDDPVAKYLPEFSELKDADGNDATVTLKQCLSHTSGLSDVSGEESEGVEDLKALMPLIAAKPLRFTPGSKWEYNQASINTAARVVEVVAKKSFPEFLEDRLFGPLGMTDTTFYLSEEQAGRLANSYKREDDGTLKAVPLFFLSGKKPTDRDFYPRANGGLFSTAGDYAKFARMILRGGELDGRRYLKEETVRQMTSPVTGDLQTGFTPGNAWGIGWCVVREPQGVSEALSPGSFGHGGAHGTQAWIDPVKSRFYLLFVQRANFPNSDASDLRRDFQNAAAPQS